MRVGVGVPRTQARGADWDVLVGLGQRVTPLRTSTSTSTRALVLRCRR